MVEEVSAQTETPLDYEGKGAWEPATPQVINSIVRRAKKEGIYVRNKTAGEEVKAGEILARILHPYDGHTLEEVRSPQDGIIFFSHHRPLVLQNALLYRITTQS